MLRLDYSGHGASGGAFADGTIGRWTDDALAVIGAARLTGRCAGGLVDGRLDRAAGGAGAAPGRVAGLVGIAAAPDFTEELMWEAMPPAERARLMRDGVLACRASTASRIPSPGR